MLDSFKCQKTLKVGEKNYHYYSLPDAEANGLKDINRLPFSLKVLLENLLRREDNETVTRTDIHAFSEWLQHTRSQHEIAYQPARVLMQDFTGVPAIVDLAAMRDAMVHMKGNPEKINPLCPIDLVIDHSVQVDHFGNAKAFTDNVHIEMERNLERYSFLKWGQDSFSNFQVVPPGTGICHQVNLEYLGKAVWAHEHDGKTFAYPDTLVGTDSHTTMINGLGVLGWGVGGIEAEAAMLGQPISMVIPEVIGFRLTGALRKGITATDLVLTVTQMLRQKGVVGKFVEFFGPGLASLPVADRATIANMAPEYGATCGFFPIDNKTIEYMELTGRDAETIKLARAYAEAQGLWHSEEALEPFFTDTLTLDLSKVEPSVAGPKRPQDRLPLSQLVQGTNQLIIDAKREDELEKAFETGTPDPLYHGDIVIAAITSCTNTSNPSVMLAAGLLAKKAIEKGLQRRSWVKSSLAPGSKVVTDYLKKADLLQYLEQLGFYLVGYGCTTCIGNSGPLDEPIANTIAKNDLIVCSILSGNRNFEGRIHPQVKANWLASPPLVVAFALAGTTRIDLLQDAIGVDAKGEPIMLRDIWPTNSEIDAVMNTVQEKMFQKEYSEVFKGDKEWSKIKVKKSKTYAWDNDSTYVKNPPYFEGMTTTPTPLEDIKGARLLALLGDSVTTDHISPAGSIKLDSPAGRYLTAAGVSPKDFNSYGSRRGNHEVMMRGTFANIRIRNEMLDNVEGGYTKFIPTGEQMSIYDAAMKYKEQHTPLIIVAGKEYGTGSSRDWAAKGTILLGIKAVVAESFERIHRSNLIGMGVLPLEFKPGEDRKTLKITGNETFDLQGLTNGSFKPKQEITLVIHSADGKSHKVPVICRLDTKNEIEYFRHGGILQYVLRKMLQN